MDARMREQFWRWERSHRGPAWRSSAAQEIASHARLRARHAWDALTRAAAKYYALLAGGPDGGEQAAAAYPQIHAAIAVQEDPAQTDVLKLLALADAPPATAAEQVGVPAETVEVWEQLFFDVRGMRRATDWLSHQVLRKELAAGNDALAARMKLALMAGVEGVQAVLALDDEVPLDEADRLLQRQLRLSLKADQALAMPIRSEPGRIAYVKAYVGLQAAEQRLELAQKKLAARCAEARNRHELAKLRLQYAQERRAVKARAQQQQSERRRQATEQRQSGAAQTQELKRYAELAEQKAASCRAAESPLAQLVWSKARRTGALVESFSLLASDRLAEPPRAALGRGPERCAAAAVNQVARRPPRERAETNVFGAA